MRVLDIQFIMVVSTDCVTAQESYYSIYRCIHNPSRQPTFPTLSSLVLDPRELPHPFHCLDRIFSRTLLLPIPIEKLFLSQRFLVRPTWACGLDVLPAVIYFSATGSLYRTAFRLSVSAVRALLDAAAPGDRPALLDRRISLLRLSPLHYVYYAARLLRPDVAGPGGNVACAVVDAPCEAGARVDACDLVGYTAMTIVAGFRSSPASLRLVPVLARHGADVNARNRFAESMLFAPIMASNADAFRELLRVGADLMQADSTGVTPLKRAAHSPQLLRIMSEVQRERSVQGMACDRCGRKGASKFCAGCHKAYYCDRECQTAAWRAGHKAVCGKDTGAGKCVDIDVDTMTADYLIPGVGAGDLKFVNSMMGATSSARMLPKRLGASFVVKVAQAIAVDPGVGCVKINVKNSDYLLVSPKGAGSAAHAALRKVIRTGGLGLSKVYLNAKWVEVQTETEEGLQGRRKAVLRIDTSKALPAPKQVW